MEGRPNLTGANHRYCSFVLLKSALSIPMIATKELETALLFRDDAQAGVEVENVVDKPGLAELIL